MKQLCDTYGITKSRTTLYHPAGNGGAERFKQTLLNMLRSLETEKQNLPVHVGLGVGPQQLRHDIGGWILDHQQRLSLA